MFCRSLPGVGRHRPIVFQPVQVLWHRDKEATRRSIEGLSEVALRDEDEGMRAFAAGWLAKLAVAPTGQHQDSRGGGVCGLWGGSAAVVELVARPGWAPTGAPCG